LIQPGHLLLIMPNTQQRWTVAGSMVRLTSHITFGSCVLPPVVVLVMDVDVVGFLWVGRPFVLGGGRGLLKAG